MQILSALAQQDNFNESEKMLAQYILSQPEEILHQSIQSISKATFTSTSTIFRLCRKIGLKGFKDFKIRLAAELQMKYNDISNINPDFPFTEDDSYSEITKKVHELFKESLNQTYALTQAEKTEAAVNMLLNAERIGIFAYGDTFLPALNFQNKMMKIEHSVQIAWLPGEDQHLATNLGPKDCGIVLSYSGESKNNYFITRLLKKNRANILVISAHPDSHIAKLANLVLQIPKSESQTVKLSTFSSQPAIDYMLNTLYACIFVANYEKNQQKRINSETLFLNNRFDQELKE